VHHLCDSTHCFSFRFACCQSFWHPYLHLNHKATNVLLQISVVGLGFGMNVNSALAAGKDVFYFTIGSI
jgi:hypothetical protein